MCLYGEKKGAKMIEILRKIFRFFFPDRGEVKIADETFRKYKSNDNSWRHDV